MMKKRFIFTALVLFGLLPVVLGGCGPSDNTIKVATSTSLMEYIVQQVGGGHVQVFNMVQPFQHPGNFDVKPADIENLANAKLFLLHGWPGETYADGLIAAADNSKLVVVKAAVDGNWMIPSVQSAAVDKVLAALIQIDPVNQENYEAAAAAYKQRITTTETAIKTRLAAADVSQVKVIASVRQADFLQWAGFQVVATFIGPQSLTPQIVQELVNTGRDSDVALVVNNIQDGLDAGKAIAEEIQAVNLNLSNFPGGYIDTDTWEKAIDHNVTLLLNVLE